MEEQFSVSHIEESPVIEAPVSVRPTARGPAPKSRAPYAPEVRQRALTLLKTGLSRAKVAKMLGADPSTVAYWAVADRQAPKKRGRPYKAQAPQPQVRTQVRTSQTDAAKDPASPATEVEYLRNEVIALWELTGKLNAALALLRARVGEVVGLQTGQMDK